MSFCGHVTCVYARLIISFWPGLHDTVRHGLFNQDQLYKTLISCGLHNMLGITYYLWIRVAWFRQHTNQMYTNCINMIWKPELGI